MTQVRRRLSRISLRTMLFGVTLLCVFLAWKGRQYAEHRSVAAWVRSVGGQPYTISKPERLLWEVWDVDLSGSSVTDLAPLEETATLRGLRASDTEVIDIRSLAVMDHLQYLALSNTKVRDLQPLESLASIEFLLLDNTAVRDISPLKAMHKLKNLNLNSTRVSDLSPLVGLTNLTFVDLGNTQVEDLSPLGRLPVLDSLQLSNTKVKDVSALAALPRLRHLDLHDNKQLNDIAPLRNAKNLQFLELSWTSVTNDDVMTLRQAIPQCSIDFHPYTEADWERRRAWEEQHDSRRHSE